MGLDLDDAFDFVGRHRQGVLVTLRRNGRPQLSNIMYAPGSGHSVRISVTEERAKTKNMRRDPRVSLHVTRADFFAYVVLDGEVSVSPVARAVDDPVVDELVELYRLLQGEHPDWDEYRESMVSQGRVVATVSAAYVYGMLGG
jgi:PPOX class probable F420-dependent enzyme